jgi:Lrp/AsnC family transcriptional regulator
MQTPGKEINLDKVDRVLLENLQRDCSIPVNELGQMVNLSGPACWKRIQRLKTAGVITAEVAICDPAKLDRGMLAFVFIQARDHSQEWLKSFAVALAQLPEVTAAYRLSGDIDYLLHVLVSDIADYDRFYQRLIRLVQLSNVSSSFAMERIKYSTAVPPQN